MLAGESAIHLAHFSPPLHHIPEWRDEPCVLWDKNENGFIFVKFLMRREVLCMHFQIRQLAGITIGNGPQKWLSAPISRTHTERRARKPCYGWHHGETTTTENVKTNHENGAQSAAAQDSFPCRTSRASHLLENLYMNWILKCQAKNLTEFELMTSPIISWLAVLILDWIGGFTALLTAYPPCKKKS